MAQNNTITGQQQAGSAPPSLVEKFLQDQLLQRGHMTKASLRSQLAKVQNTMDKTRNKMDKCKQKVEETLCAMREHEAALYADELKLDIFNRTLGLIPGSLEICLNSLLNPSV